ncbi:TetR family transcriptional regulator [Roseovarius sp. C7]|uniref:TetR family transcriptional regulator n=1 Tax=Roseovarius sp. C7 TaxID=3398643 RepID=UPI0039F72D38
MTQATMKRDAEATKKRILKVGIREFCASGYSGSRIQTIAKKSKCNIRMIYHYFGSKEGLYLAALEQVYGGIRESETKLGFVNLEPDDAIRSLVEFTFDHHQNNREFVDLVVVENVQNGHYLKKVENLPNESSLLIASITNVLEAGVQRGIFREGVDAFQLYISILSLSFFHLSNASTLSIMYQRSVSDKDWLADRRQHVIELILGFLRP